MKIISPLFLLGCYCYFAAACSTMLKKTLQYLFLLALLFVFLEAIGYILFFITDRGMGKHYADIRSYLRATEVKNTARFFTPALSLGYFNTPGYVASGEVQVNSAGCRGVEITQLKPARTYRILFMGGSTTYCYGVDSFEQSYPFITGQLLKPRLYALPAFKEKYDSLQVINAGLDGGTSYEMLYHYIAKMKYYQPDMVVLHEGGNDALQFSEKEFSPDYTHKRQPAQQMAGVSPLGRFLLGSRFVSFVFIAAFYGNAETDSHIGDVPPGHTQPLYYKWLQTPKEALMANARTYPFNTNTRMLVNEIKSDSALVVLFPFVYSQANIEQLANKFQGADNISAAYVAGIKYNATVYDTISRQLGTGYLPYNDSIVSAANFIDDCHLNAAGNQQKAAYAAGYIYNMLQANMSNVRH